MQELNTNKVIITERGWAGHFCCSSNCNFRRNTLIEYNDKKIVVSTVGNCCFLNEGKAQTIGLNRYYETMAFEAKYDKPYWDSDVTKEVGFDSKWYIGKITINTDKEANQMHEDVVKELSKKIKEI